MPLADVATVRVFADLMSPAVEGTIEDLFNDGWNWKSGHHVMGPYRIGVRVLMGM